VTKHLHKVVLRGVVVVDNDETGRSFVNLAAVVDSVVVVVRVVDVVVAVVVVVCVGDVAVPVAAAECAVNVDSASSATGVVLVVSGSVTGNNTLDTHQTNIHYVILHCATIKLHHIIFAITLVKTVHSGIIIGISILQ